jgi:phospholipid/cholesterol/gamma-HCH transport system substrate-binding protein
MMTKEQKLRLGIFLLISFGLAAAILAIFIVPQVKQERNPFHINFQGASVNGLNVGSPVKYLGVEVGTVDRIAFNPGDLTSILVSTKIQKTFQVKKDMEATLTYTGITGQKFVELSGGRNDSPNLAPNGVIKTGRGLGEKAEDIMANIDEAVKGINNLLAPDNQTRISLFLENAEKSAGIISDVLEKKRENLEGAIMNIESSSLEFRDITKNLRQVTEDLSQLTGKLEESAGKVLDSIAQRFSEKEMGSIMKNLESLIQASTSSLNKIQDLLFLQQAEMKNTFKNLELSLENLSRLSRDVIEDPTILIWGRREKKK